MPDYPSNIAELPKIEELPDLFTFFDGRKVSTPEQWQERRNELLQLMQFYLYGYKHPTPEANSHLRILSEKERDALEQPPFFPGFPASRPEAAVSVTDNGRTAEILLDAFRVPAHANGCQAIICVGNLMPEQIERIVAQGYAFIALNTASVYSDGNGDGTGNPRTGAYCTLYPYKRGVYEFDSGVLMGWCWGVSRIIDAIKNNPSLGIAWNKCAVTGCSRNGKAAVMSAAFDDRIAIAAPSDSGGGGLSGFRYSSEGQIFRSDAVPQEAFSRNEFTTRAIASNDEIAWFCSRAEQFIVGDNNLRSPFDAHSLAAAVAPRPLIAWSGSELQAWLNSPATALNCIAAADVYEFLGVPENIGCCIRGGPHAVQDCDLEQLFHVMDGSAKPSNFISNPYDLENHWIRHGRPRKNILWSYDKYLCERIKRTVTIYDVNGNKFIQEYDNPQSGELVYVNSDTKITFTVLTRRQATSFGLNLRGGSPNGVGIGFTSPLLKPVYASIDGVAVDINLERYGVRLTAEHIPAKPKFTLQLDNIALEAIPNEVFSLSVELFKTKAKDWFGNEIEVLDSPLGETIHQMEG